MKLDRWIVYGNCLVGYVFDDKYIPNGTRVISEMIRHLDVSNNEAECLDGKYKLLSPGTEEEHNRPLVGAV